MSTQCREIQGGLCEITQSYKAGNHEGIDIVNKNYTLGHIVAHTAGTVVGYRNNCNGFEQGSYGNYVKIKHDNGYYTLYAHMAYNTVSVRTGERVSRGQALGYMGNTGYSFGGHLHFEVRNKNDVKIDPTPYLNADLPGNEPTPAPTPTPGPSDKFNIGDKVIINGPLYVSSTAASPAGNVNNKTTYITRKNPGSAHPYNTTGDLGWMNESDIKKYEEPTPVPTPQPTGLKVGDTVKIIGYGNGSCYGTSNTAGGIGWTRSILKIWNGKAYPYQVGNSSGTTGFYKAEALQKK